MTRRNNILFNDFIPDATLDFHGRDSYSAHEIEVDLEKFILEAVAYEYKHLVIVTGKGEKIRPQVEKLLCKTKAVKTFRTASYYNGQSGAFEVELR
jgi:DNA-nicking Smr family endonuclease